MVYRVKIYVSYLDEFDDCYHYIETKKYSSQLDLRNALFDIVNDYFIIHFGRPISYNIDDK